MTAKKKSDKKRASRQARQQMPSPKNKRLKYRIVIALIFVVTILAAIVTYVVSSNQSTTVSLSWPEELPPPREYVPAEITHDDFAGSMACGGCHPDQYARWLGSAHGQAGGKPEDVNIIAKYDGKPLVFKDATVIPLRRDGKYIFLIGFTNQPEFEIEVKAVVGGGHMVGGGTQTFFVEAPDGSVRFLPFDFSRHRNEWFVQLQRNHHWVPITPDISLSSDLANWPPRRLLGEVSGLSNCQNCHGSQITADFNMQTQTFQTQYTTLQINCESCHGPGKRHVVLMQQQDRDTLSDIGLASQVIQDKDASLNVCFRCHAVKDVLAPGYIDGKPLESYYSLKLPMIANEIYTSDGRVRSFAYQLNHLFSDCYINGSMTCVDCHAPHSLHYRDNFGKPLQGRFDDGQCTGCHPGMIESPEQHTKHPVASEGSRCVHCHMPYLQAKGIGEDVPYARSDHTIAIPRPAFDASIGIDNACQKCHRDKSIEWLDAKTREWYGVIKPQNELVRKFVSASRTSDARDAASLLLVATADHPIAQVRSLFEYLKRFLSVNTQTLDSDVLSRLKHMAGSDDIDLKAFALMALHFAYGNRQDIHQFLTTQLQALGEKEISVRRRWALAMDYMGQQYFLENHYGNAIKCYQKALVVQSEDGYVWINLGDACIAKRLMADGISAYQKALDVLPDEYSIYIKLARVYLAQQEYDQAEKILRQALEKFPGSDEVQALLEQVSR